MSITQITDHADQGVARLINQFRDKVKIAGWLRGLIGPGQTIEDVLFQLLNNRNVFVAVGVNLDIIGKIVGEGRQGRDDDAYRRAIFARIGINSSQGTPENLISIFNYLTNSVRCFYNPSADASLEIYSDHDFTIELDGNGAEAFAFDGGIDGLGFGDVFDTSVGGTLAYLVTTDVVGIYLICDAIISGGVRLDFVGYYDGDEAFTFDGDSQGQGLGDALDSTVGGKFATLIPLSVPFSFDSDSKRTRGFGDVYDSLIGGEFASA